ncbi:DUF4395 domain-containing protein [Halalkalibacter alkalisediminis]|uniref:DUF4395 domain-containing protein n=1 Tax=Halalkalibacter alkalisediminis TaxID=935616 RepID=A0ABV6NHZ9_9BACI|nr:DUF4395 domain-containing protein [Halalkalibacter alkalisediminis]
MGIPKPLVQTNQIFIVLSVLLGLYTSYWVLLFPFIIGIITLITKKNLVMRIGRLFLKKSHDQYVLEDRNQQLFNQWIATIFLGLSVFCFYINYSLLGYLFSVMVVLAAGVAILGFCIGCTIRYRYLMWRHKRTSIK